jgi:ribosomal protein L12E/L44/L45/RPP1/RPP2
MPATPPVEAARKEPKPEKKKDEKKAESKDEENKEEKKGGMTADTFAGLKFRLLGRQWLRGV